MHDFGALVYLDLHKTGSTYISAWLRRCIRLEEVKFKKHGCVKDDYRPDAFYFITVRHPLSLYSSLYRYGLDARGALFNRLVKRGHAEEYESFDRFVAFCLDPANADHLGFGYTPAIAEQIGFMSHRYMRLSLHHADDRMARQLQQGARLDDLRGEFITDMIIPNETLTEGLRRLAIDIRPDLFDPRRACRFLENQERVNVSRTAEDEIALTDAGVLKALAEKERLLLDLYDTDAGDAMH